MSARLPLGISLTAAPILMIPAVSVLGALLEDAPDALSAASLPLSLLVPLLVSVAGVLMVRAEHRPHLRRTLAFTTVCLAVALLSVAAIVVPVLVPGGVSEDSFLMALIPLGTWTTLLGGLGTALGALVMAVQALAGTSTVHAPRA